MGDIQRGGLRIKFFSSNSDVRRALDKMARDLAEKGFGTGESGLRPALGVPTMCRDRLTFKYGGAWLPDLELIKATILKTFGKPETEPTELDLCWHHKDPDIFVFVPNAWAQVRKEWLWYDPVLCCHMTGTEKEFYLRKEELYKQGFHIKTGVRGR